LLKCAETETSKASWGERERERERERENCFCKAGTPEGQQPIYAAAYVTVHNNDHFERKKVWRE